VVQVDLNQVMVRHLLEMLVVQQQAEQQLVVVLLVAIWVQRAEHRFRPAEAEAEAAQQVQQVQLDPQALLGQQDREEMQ
jgi:hypothetical protein